MSSLPIPAVTIVGGGPVGCLLGAMLIERGLDVNIYERRPDPRTIKDAGKSINLALSV
jgi:kynurenine 3-monooxygenase